MKKISILIAVVSTFIVGLTRAQEVYYGESFELNSPLTPNQSIEYKANDFIHLKKRVPIIAPKSQLCHDGD